MRQELFKTVRGFFPGLSSENVRASAALAHEMIRQNQGLPRPVAVYQRQNLLSAEDAARHSAKANRMPHLPFGQLALQGNFISPAQLQEALEKQAAGGGKKIGQLLVEAGHLKPHQLEALLERQEGKIFWQEDFSDSVDRLIFEPGRVKAGQTVGLYRLQNLIREDRLGVRYQALRENDKQAFEIIFLSPVLLSQPGFLEAYKENIRKLKELNHVSICRVLGVVEHAGIFGLVREFAPGLALDVYLQKNPRLKPEVIGGMLIEIAGAFRSAEEAGLCHGSLSPSDIFVGDDGTLKIVDLGVPDFYDKSFGAGAVPLEETLFYCPEDWAGLPKTSKTDQHSLGQIAYLLFARKTIYGDGIHSAADGSLPTGALTHLDRASIHLLDAIPPLKQMAPKAPEEMSAIVARLLATDPDKRYSCFEDVIRDLENVPDLYEQEEAEVEEVEDIFEPKDKTEMILKIVIWSMIGVVVLGLTAVSVMKLFF